MKSRRIQFEAPRIELTREEILADLLYPAASPEVEGRSNGRRPRQRPARRQGRR
jgi:hypothetical protein